MDDQSFSKVQAKYELTIAADLLATAPHESKKRESLYSTLWGARGLLNYMQLNANAAAAIKTPKTPEQDGTTDYHVEPLADSGYDDEGFPRADEDDY